MTWKDLVCLFVNRSRSVINWFLVILVVINIVNCIRILAYRIGRILNLSHDEENPLCFRLENWHAQPWIIIQQVSRKKHFLCPGRDQETYFPDCLYDHLPASVSSSCSYSITTSLQGYFCHHLDSKWVPSLLHSQLSFTIASLLFFLLSPRQHFLYTPVWWLYNLWHLPSVNISKN